MFGVAWVLVSAVAWCCVSPLPPVYGTTLDVPSSSSSSSSSSSNNALVPQEKRLLKYLPTTDSDDWEHEGTKRAALRNYLRFGRSEKTFEDAADPIQDAEDYMEKRNRNFLRFGRNRNFLRFGRSDPEEFGVSGASLGNPEEEEEEFVDYPTEEKRTGHRNYLRFGRGNRNFLRFGRSDNKNFLRFGRSVDRHLSEDKPQQDTRAAHTSQKTKEGAATRTKRSPTHYNYVVLPSRGPGAWTQTYHQDPTDEALDETLEDPQVFKRDYNKSFLRFGRDRNFLRFGKRSDEDEYLDNVIQPDPYPRFARAPQKNFLRFG